MNRLELDYFTHLVLRGIQYHAPPKKKKLMCETFTENNAVLMYSVFSFQLSQTSSHLRKNTAKICRCLAILKRERLLPQRSFHLEKTSAWRVFSKHALEIIKVRGEKYPFTFSDNNIDCLLEHKLHATSYQNQNAPL